MRTAQCPGRRRRLLSRTLVVAAAVVVAPLLVETIVQIVGDPRAQEIDEAARTVCPAYWRLSRLGMLVADDDPQLRYRMRPGFDATIGAIEYRVNELGLRGGPIAQHKPTGAQRVLLVGDSYAYGLGVAESDAIAAQLELRLDASHDSNSVASFANSANAVEVVNFSVPGYQTGQELALLERVGFALAPDLVVLLYYANDNVDTPTSLAPSVGALYHDDLPLPCSWKPALSRSFLYSELARLDAERRARLGEFDFHVASHWPLTSSRLRAFERACREHGAAFLLAALPEVTNAKDLHDDDSLLAIDHARATKLAHDESWPLVDLRAELLARAPAIGLLKLGHDGGPPDPHFNAQGCRVVADAIAPAVRSLLAARVAGDADATGRAVGQRAGAAAAPRPASSNPSR